MMSEKLAAMLRHAIESGDGDLLGDAVKAWLQGTLTDAEVLERAERVAEKRAETCNIASAEGSGSGQKRAGTRDELPVSRR